MCFKSFRTGLAAIGAMTISAFAVSDAKAVTKDLDLMFVIDKSGSMSDEFTDLADNVEDFFNGLDADSRTGSVAGGLVTYLSTPSLDQAITANIADVKTALTSTSVGGGTENGIGAIGSVLPGGSLSGSAGWRNNTVKSTVLITDEDADDASGTTPYADLAANVAGAGYLNNIISDISDWEPAAVPTGAVFSLNGFNADPTGFLDTFAEAKLSELESAPVTPGGVIPLPAALPLVLTGLGAIGGLGALRRRKEKSAI